MKYTAFTGASNNNEIAIEEAMKAFEQWQSQAQVVVVSVTPTESQSALKIDDEVYAYHSYTLLVAYREVQPVISPWHSYYSEHEAAWVVINRESKQEIALVGEYIDPRNLGDQAKMDAQSRRYAQLIAAAPQLLTIIESLDSTVPQATLDACDVLLNKIHA